MKYGRYPNFPASETLDNLRARPYKGWINAAREALGLTLERLGKQIGKSPQAVKDAERRELDGSISLKRLREIAAAMDMELVYGLVPKGGTVEELLENRAKSLAEKVYQRTYQTMLLEDQLPEEMERQKEREVDDITRMILNESPQKLWS